MSQAKVDARKNEKANRKETMKKEKIKKKHKHFTIKRNGFIKILRI